jgi:hypothetical protein
VTPPAPPASEKRVYLSASNHFYLALKTFGYSLLGYLTIALLLIAFVLLGGFLGQFGR